MLFWLGYLCLVILSLVLVRSIVLRPCLSDSVDIMLFCVPSANFSDPFDGDAMEAVRNAAIAAELRDLGIGTPDHSKVEDAKEPGQVAEERDQKAVVRLEGSVVARRVINGSDAMFVLVKWSPAGL